MVFGLYHLIKGEAVPPACPLTTLLVVVSVFLLSGALVVGEPPSDAYLLDAHHNVHRVHDDPVCRPASVAVSVSTPIINAFTQLVVIPAVQAESNMAVIPEQEEDHIWVDRMVLHQFQVDTITVHTAEPDTSSVTVNVKDFGLTVNETRFRYTYLGVRCYGHFTASLNETDIDAVMELTLLPASRWNATFTRLNFTWGTLAIQHVLDSKMCGIAQSIIELFTGQMDAYIAEKVKRKLDVDGKNKATEVVNSAFTDANVLVLSPPIMTEERLSVVLDATPASVGCPPQPPVTVVPPLLPRDIAVHTTVHDINNALYNAVLHDWLEWLSPLPDSMNTSLLADILPAVYEMCPECPMYTLVKCLLQPVVVFLPLNTVTLTLRDLIVGLYVVPRTAAERAAVQGFIAKHTFSASGNVAGVPHYLKRACRPSVNAEKGIPVLALSATATFGVRNITFENGRAARFSVLPLQDLSVDVVASLIGEINTVNFEQQGMWLWNTFVMPIINAEQPYKLPYVRKAALNMTLVKADGGFNVGLMGDFISGIMQKVVQMNVST